MRGSTGEKPCTCEGGGTDFTCPQSFRRQRGRMVGPHARNVRRWGSCQSPLPVGPRESAAGEKPRGGQQCGKAVNWPVSQEGTWALGWGESRAVRSVAGLRQVGLRLACAPPTALRMPACGKAFPCRVSSREHAEARGEKPVRAVGGAEPAAAALLQQRTGTHPARPTRARSVARPPCRCTCGCTPGRGPSRAVGVGGPAAPVTGTTRADADRGEGHE